MDALTKGMAGCTAIVHGAARFLHGGGYRAYYQDNVVGTQHMLTAARTAGVRRFVWIGAAACLLGGKPIRHADESWPLHEKYSPYIRTKTIADATVLRAGTDRFSTCVVRPGWIWGRNDDRIVDAMAKATTEGKMIFIDGGKHEIVTSHVDNVVHAIVLALEKGANGQAYFVFDDDTVRIRDFIARLLKSRNFEAPEKNVPFAMAWIMACIMETVWAVGRHPGEPPVNRMMVKLNGGPFVVSDCKARADLGYRPVITRAEGLARLSSGSRH